MKRLGISFLLCALVLWVSPGLTAALCVKLVELHKDHSHEGYSHAHSGKAAGHEGHSHAHSEKATGGEGYHDAPPVGAGACCLQVFVGGTDAVTLAAPSPLAKPALSGVVLAGLPTPFLPALLHHAPAFSTPLKTSTKGLQGPLYAFFSAYLI